MVGLFKQPKRHLKKLIRDGEYTDAIVFGKNFSYPLDNLPSSVETITIYNWYKTKFKNMYINPKIKVN